MDINKQFVGSRIKQIRKELGHTLEEFGARVDKASKSNVSKWEKGLSIPNNKRMKIIAELGGTSVENLMYGSLSNFFVMNFPELVNKKYKKYADIVSMSDLRLLVDEFDDRNFTFDNIEEIKQLTNQYMPTFIDQINQEIKNQCNFIQANLDYIDTVVQEFSLSTPVEKYRDTQFLKRFIYNIPDFSNDELIEHSKLIEELYIAFDTQVNDIEYFMDTFAYLCNEEEFLDITNDFNLNNLNGYKKEFIHYRYSNTSHVPNLNSFEFIVKVNHPTDMFTDKVMLLLSFFPGLDKPTIKNRFIDSKVVMVVDQKITIGHIDEELNFIYHINCNKNKMKIESFNKVFPIRSIFF